MPKRLEMVILYLQGHLTCCIGSKVMVFLLNWLVLPTGGVPSGRVCPAACAAGLFKKDQLDIRCYDSARLD